jgi:hypothetical protein
MSVRKRTWTWKGVERQAFVVDYTDQGGDPAAIVDHWAIMRAVLPAMTAAKVSAYGLR